MQDPLPAISPTLADPIVQLALATALGLFLGLEREWSQKAAGIRTFGLVSALGALLTIYDQTTCAAGGVEPVATGSCPPILAGVGGLFVTVLAAALMAGGIVDDERGLNLTTAVSLFVAYGVGMLVAAGAPLAATVVTVGSSILLVFKRELHGFAWGLSREELRSVTEFAILAFVVYPLLPAESVSVQVGASAIAFEPRVVWLLVVFVAGLGIVNYALVSLYGSRGLAITGFFGGLASSTAVVGAMREHAAESDGDASYATAGVLLADAAMAVRNLLIVVVFTVDGVFLLEAAVPAAAVFLASLALAAVGADWSSSGSVDLESPFSMRNALTFGLLFLLVIVVGGLAKAYFGVAGFYAAAAVAGLVSSAGATTTAVVLFRTGSLAAGPAAIAVTVAIATSVAVKAALAATGPSRAFRRQVGIRTAVLLVVAAVAVGLVTVPL